MGPPRYVGPLGVMRSLARLGVKVYGLKHSVRSAASSSRHCAGVIAAGDNGRPWDDDSRTLSELIAAGKSLGPGTVLIPGSDEWAVFVARRQEELGKWFQFPTMPVELVEELAAKDGLYRLATAHAVPTPHIAFPRSRDEAIAEASRLQYPVMLKPVYSRPDVLAKAVVDDAGQLIEAYRWMEESPEAPNVMFQEYIPGTDSDVWIFNGYFNAASRCLAAFTGVKLRQHPARMGIASLGELRQNDQVIDLTCRFLREVGYRGIVDIGYRFDVRNGKYNVLDVNPRLGGAFRMFVDERGMDVARAMYLDLIDEAVPAILARNGRRWINEQADLVAATHYRRLEGLRFIDWLRSLRGVREGATWALDDPLPFGVTMWWLATETLAGKWTRFRQRIAAELARRFAAAPRPGETAA